MPKKDLEKEQYLSGKDTNWLLCTGMGKDDCHLRKKQSVTVLFYMLLTIGS